MIRLEKEKKPRGGMSTTQVIAIGFLAAIAVGALLLCMPFASASGKSAGFIDALFTATTCVCVTGLTVVDTFSSWSPAGQAIMLCLIQVGGLGVVSLTTSVMLVIGRRVTLRDRLLLESALNLDTLTGLVQFLRRVLKWTFIFEGTGALCYTFTLVPKLGWQRGLWSSVFLAISAFCNAGIDVIGPDSLAPFCGNAWINLITVLLITLGGAGFIVWWDVARTIRLAVDGEIKPRRIFSRMHLHTKLVLTVTAVLIFAGALIILLLEYTNPGTLGGKPFGEKLLAALFQSVTCRTAGFYTVPQQALRDPTCIVCMLLMFIGGSPVGTAGGVKTTTVALVILSAVSVARGREESSVFRRTLPLATLRKAIAVVTVSFGASLVAIALLSAVTQGSLCDVMFEAVSAISTTGLSRGFTGTMNTAGCLIVITCMYMGRIGPISLAIAFNFGKPPRCLAVFPTEDITVG